MPRHLAPDIARDITRQITSGVWDPGSLLPNERMMAEQYGVARNTVRNAPALLEKEGLITRHVGRGTIVKGPASSELRGLVDKITGAAPIDILNLRLIIEPQTAALAAVTASAQDIAHIAEATTSMAEAETHEAFERWDNAFHGRIVEASRNEFLISLHRILSIIRSRPAMQELRRRGFTPANRQLYCEQHGEIMEALRHRDASASAAAMRAHLMTRKRVYFGE